MSNKLGELERAVRGLTTPVLGQYPRPWMTELANPSEADVFVVGANQATAYAPEIIGPHDRFIDAHFNRNGLTCRKLYEEVRGGPSPTRSHSDLFVERLKDAGARKLIETNVVCFSTQDADELKIPSNRSGLQRGIEIFRELLRILSPKVAIVHGSGTVKMFKRYHGVLLPNPPKQPTEFPTALVRSTTVFVIPSLGKPKVDNWAFPREPYLREVARRAADHLAQWGT